jgi:hypothetical protein
MSCRGVLMPLGQTLLSLRYFVRFDESIGGLLYNAVIRTRLIKEGRGHTKENGYEATVNRSSRPDDDGFIGWRGD